MNTALLKAEMIRHGDTQKSLAEAMGLSQSILNAKINDTRSEFRQKEISFIKRRYNLTAKDIDNIFFSRKVS